MVIVVDGGLGWGGEWVRMGEEIDFFGLEDRGGCVCWRFLGVGGEGGGGGVTVCGKDGWWGIWGSLRELWRYW